MRFERTADSCTLRVVSQRYTSDVTVSSNGCDWFIIADGTAIHKCPTFADAEWILRNYYLDQNDIDDAKAWRGVK